MIVEHYRQLLESGSSNLLEFLLSVEAQPRFSPLEKKKFLELLLNDLLVKNWNEEIKAQGLKVIKVLGRDPTNSDPLFTKEGIITLLKLAGLYQSISPIDTPSSREALKCIANCIYLSETVKLYLEQENIIDSCGLLLKSKGPLSLDSQFLASRILFFMSAKRSDLIKQLIQSDISFSIEKILSENIAQIEDPVLRAKIDIRDPINPYSVTSEALVLLFGLLLDDAPTDGSESQAASGFKNCLVPIFKLIFKVPYTKPQPLVPPLSKAFQALMQFSYDTMIEVWEAQSEWTSKLYDPLENPTFIATTLVGLLDDAIHVLIPSGNPDDDGLNMVDTTLVPLLAVLFKLAKGNPGLKGAMAELMLPDDKDRLLPVHEGRTLSAYLIRLMTSTMMPNTQKTVCETLFVLCNENASIFSQKVGYGNAIGFLVNKGIPFDQPEGNSEESDGINPITGQYVSEEKMPDLKDMTDEEKEREAERLFVLFERLKKTGIIDVENPIAKAMRENQGRFEEINSDSDDD